MIRKILLVVFILSTTAPGFAQLRSPERAALKGIGKKRWAHTKHVLDKALKKDSLDAALRFIYAQFYFSPANPAFHVDSANYYLEKALTSYSLETSRERDRMKRNGMDSLDMIAYRMRIDSAAFQRAKIINTEGSFIHFLTNFPYAVQRQEAMMLRDEAAYLDAVKVNTYESFLRFLEKYPSAVRASEAKSTYERLLYQTKTKERTLAAYESFLREYPASPYRREVERHIFEIYTAAGTLESFANFLSVYPPSSVRKRAEDILFHLLPDEESVSVYDSLLSDSLLNIRILNDGYLVPIFREGRFGFMNYRGETVMQPVMRYLHQDYICGNIESDVLLAENSLIARDGSVLLRDSVVHVEDLGSGFLLVETPTCTKVVHKSGFTVNDCIDEAKILNGAFIILRKGKQWALYTLAGRSLTLHEWDDIACFGEVFVFKKENTYKLARHTQIAASADGRVLELSAPFDDVKPWPDGALWTRAAEFEGLLDASLEPAVPFNTHRLKPAFFGTIAELPSGEMLFSKSGSPYGAFRRVKMHEPWVAVNIDTLWKLMDAKADRFIGRFYDSIRFEGPFAVALNHDSVFVHVPGKPVMNFPGGTAATFVPGKDSITFLVIANGKKKSIYTNTGTQLFTAEFDNLQYAGENVFVFSKKEKKGLIDLQGKVLLLPEYDAIGSVVDGVVTLLKNLRFGAYNVRTHKLIKPQYEKNLVVYNQNHVTAFLNGHYGLINWDNKPQSKFEYTELKYWNDSTMLGKRKADWVIYDFILKKNVEEFIQSVEFIRNDQEERIAIVKQKDLFGVISSRSGFVIPPAFTYLVNIGSSEEPLYFTEKHVEEALIFVVIYYDKHGKLLYRQAYDEEDYEKIYCVDSQ